jgi:hypothetical protein
MEGDGMGEPFPITQTNLIPSHNFVFRGFFVSQILIEHFIPTIFLLKFLEIVWGLFKNAGMWLMGEIY